VRKLTSLVDHGFSFELETDELLHLEIDQRGVDVEVEVLAPPGGRGFKVDTLNRSQGLEDVPILAEVRGTYIVRVWTSSSQGGDYMARLVARRQATPEDRKRAAAAVAYSRAEDSRKAKAPFRASEDLYKEAVRLGREAGDDTRTADAFYHLGKILNGAREWQAALEYDRQALFFYQKLGNTKQEGLVLNNIGFNLDKLAEWEEARDMYQASFDLADKLGDEKTKLTALLNLALMEIELGEVGKAFSTLDKASRLEKEPGKKVMVLNARGRMYCRMGEIKESLKLHHQALKNVKRKGMEAQHADTLTHIADAYRSAGKFEFAAEYYRRALDKDQSLEARANTLNNLGLTHYQAGEIGDALTVYGQALATYQELKAPADEAIAWVNIGYLNISRGNLEKASEAFLQSLAIDPGSKRGPTEAASFFGLAWVDRSRRNLIGAQGFAKKAIDGIERLRAKTAERTLRISFLAQRQDFYDLLIDILMERNRLQPTKGYDLQAFEVSERSKARGLLDGISGEGGARVLPLREIQTAVLDDDSVLLAYHLGKDTGYLWVVTSSSFASFYLPSWSELEPLVKKAHLSLKKSHHREDATEAVEAARALSQRLLGPIANRLGTRRLLIVVPPLLQYVPFAVLPQPGVPESAKKGRSWPAPLLEKNEVYSAPSGSVLATLRRRRAGRQVLQDVALIANPSYSRRLKALRFTKAEAAAIERIVRSSGRKVLPLLKGDANRDRLLNGTLDGYGTLHFAVHGKLNEEDSGQSALVLSDLDAAGWPRDPFLRAHDIEALRFQADLVVLSACESGLGQQIPGEGLTGLTQAFFLAGTSRIVVSLWKVEDLATATLMQIFYDNLFIKEMKPSEALREAQLSMWRNPRWSAPYYWAGFTFQGDPM
jgi:CHAT domain-containing protein/tetratricopeptide (TPR) repeat protein